MQYFLCVERRRALTKLEQLTPPEWRRPDQAPIQTTYQNLKRARTGVTTAIVQTVHVRTRSLRGPSCHLSGKKRAIVNASSGQRGKKYRPWTPSMR